MSIDWFDVEAVKATIVHQTTADAIAGREWNTGLARYMWAFEVLKAIAALRDPTVYGCRRTNTAEFLCPAEAMLERVWLVAKEVVGE